MPHYRSTISHNGLRPGDIVEINELEREAWEGEIDAGFLAPVDYVPGIGVVSPVAEHAIESRVDDDTADE